MTTPTTPRPIHRISAEGAAPAVRVPLSDWQRDLAAVKAIHDPVLRARAAVALAEAAVAAWEEAAKGVRT